MRAAARVSIRVLLVEKVQDYKSLLFIKTCPSFPLFFKVGIMFQVTSPGRVMLTLCLFKGFNKTQRIILYVLNAFLSLDILVFPAAVTDRLITIDQ